MLKKKATNCVNHIKIIFYSWQEWVSGKISAALFFCTLGTWPIPLHCEFK